jgi:hypothetical protein
MSLVVCCEEPMLPQRDPLQELLAVVDGVKRTPPLQSAYNTMPMGARRRLSRVNPGRIPDASTI